MSKTKNSFHDKWHKNKDLAFENTLKENSEIQNWILNRNGFENLESFKSYLAKTHRILDAGCGNGRITALLRAITDFKQCEIVGIDLVAHKVAKDNLKEKTNVKFYAKDLLEDLSVLGKFDFIYCQEVLHHTSDPELGFKNLCRLLESNGEIAIYVYKTKAPIREFVDDYIRDNIKNLPYEEAMEVCDQITEFGKQLSNQNIKIKVPNLDILKIKEGEYDLQRFMYHFFLKCFWNNDLEFNDNSVINYDWYHPEICFRYDIKEVENWFKSENLKIIHSYEDFYGITIRGVKQN
jgi:SAM-dependent methyltransferase